MLWTTVTTLAVIARSDSDEAIHRAAQRKNGLLRRFAPRNDGVAVVGGSNNRSSRAAERNVTAPPVPLNL
jgi:hypothetical protein